MTGIYTWDIELEYLWDYEDEGEENTEIMTVASPDFNGACKKAKEIFERRDDNKPFKDDEFPKVTHKIKTVEIIGVGRMSWLDG